MQESAPERRPEEIRSHSAGSALARVGLRDRVDERLSRGSGGVLKQLAQRLRQGEMHALSADRFFLNGRSEVSLEIFDAFLHDILRRAGTGRDQDGLYAPEPIVTDFGNTIDEIGGDAEG